MNIRTGYQFRMFKVDAGIDNLADRHYMLPLGGRYLDWRLDWRDGRPWHGSRVLPPSSVTMRLQRILPHASDPLDTVGGSR